VNALRDRLVVPLSKTKLGLIFARVANESLEKASASLDE
jgi:hypothetical protein